MANTDSKSPNTNGIKATLRDFPITFKNFSGRETRYNRAGNRNFAIVLDDETADELLAQGWNIHVKEYADGGRRNTLPVSIGYSEKYQPIVVMVTPKGEYFKKTNLTEETVGELDAARVVRARVILNGRTWSNAQGNSGIKAWLDNGYFVIEKDVFADEFPEEPSFDDDVEIVSAEEAPF